MILDHFQKVLSLAKVQSLASADGILEVDDFRDVVSEHLDSLLKLGEEFIQVVKSLVVILSLVFNGILAHLTDEVRLSEEVMNAS